MAGLSVHLVVPTNKWLRLDVLPFLVLYSATLYWACFIVQEEIYARLVMLAVLLIHLLTHLSSHWSPRFKAINQFSKVHSVHQATYVVLHLQKQNQKSLCDIVPVHSLDGVPTFYFHNKKYIFDSDQQCFIRLKPKVNLPVPTYKNLKSEYQAQRCLFDDNELPIPIRSFNDLLKDQLMEPFSFFQFFSVSLWLMDENRFYSLLTLGMLFMTSCTVVLQRIRTMMTMRQMKLSPCYIKKLENEKWIKVPSSQLRPGDVVQVESAHSVKECIDPDQQKKDDAFFKQLIPFSDKLPTQFFKNQEMNTGSYKKLQCDLLVLQGNCIVDESILTGESVPQIKDEVNNDEVDLDIKGKHKNNMLFCGTEVVQTFNDLDPESKCIARVVRTGFDTSKGKLIRTVLFNNENVNVKQYDAYVLIFILLILSMISSAYVLYQGLMDPTRDRNKLFLRCILIITTVVPPELPMILSIAVNGSLMYLQTKQIFCTESFRIPLAGQVSVLAFDKTGTLTVDQLKFKGIVEKQELEKQEQDYKLTSLRDLSMDTQVVLAGCHSLLIQNREVIGDPLEKLFFQESNWEYSNLTKQAVQRGTKETVRILRQFYFESELKRMATVVQTKDGKKVVVKGAPEVLETLYRPTTQLWKDNYRKCYTNFTAQGMRVLALASREYTQNDQLENDRSSFENDLVFQGFLITHSLLKWDTKTHLDLLRKAKFQVMMITGDNLLTALAVAQELNLGSKPKDHNKCFSTLALRNGRLVLTHTNKEDTELQISGLLAQVHRESAALLGMDGECLSFLTNTLPTKQLAQLLKRVQVFGRTSPAQKEQIVSQLKQLGVGVLMCGDGTNDVGALKKADVGIALVGYQGEENDSYEKEQQRKALRKQRKQQMLQQQQRGQQVHMDDLLGEQYKFGDACIAAPFTSKEGSSIKCVAKVLKQGICTQVTTIQTYKILTLTSIISAYSFTMLHLQSLKFSESQSTITGILMTINYFYFSNNKPLKQISGVRPARTIFEPYFIISVLGQLAIHLYAMELCFQIGIKYDNQEINHDEEFKPTFLNTVAFFVNFISQQCIFLFNHGGLPFNTPLTQNKKYLKWLVYPLLGALFISQNVNDEINWFLQLHYDDIPQEALTQLLRLLLGVVTSNYLLEQGLKFLKYGQVYDYL